MLEGVQVLPSVEPVSEPSRTHLIRSRPVGGCVKTEFSKYSKRVSGDKSTSDIVFISGAPFTDRKLSSRVQILDKLLEARDEGHSTGIGLMALRVVPNP